MLDSLPHCSACHRPIRPARAPKTDWPGTVATGARGLCASCYSSAVKHDRAALAGKPRLKPGPKTGSRRERVITQMEQLGVEKSPCVLVRVDLTPAAYRTLNGAGVNIAKMLSEFATHAASQIEARRA